MRTRVNFLKPWIKDVEFLICKGFSGLRPVLKNPYIFLLLLSVHLEGYAASPKTEGKRIKPDSKTPVIASAVHVDKVWAGHPVGFSLLTVPPHQYIAYYNAERRMIAGMRGLDDNTWTLYELKSKMDRPPAGKPKETSTILGWDSHNYVTMAVDQKGDIHLSGNMHGNGLTYFRTQKPNDITTFVQIDTMVGGDEDRTTYPKFMNTPEGNLIFHYRSGRSGDGIDIYNIYDVASQTWSRLLDSPLTDGKGRMSAYLQEPVIGPDGWFHVSWVWRDTPDASSNHDLSYMKSPDRINWYTVRNEKIELPVTIDTKYTIVDPIPVGGGIINGSGKVGFDNDGKVVIAYHKFDEKGNTQVYCARYENDRWVIYKLTNWDYRWYFSGGGSLPSFDIRLGSVKPCGEGLCELYYWHKKYGSGTWLLNERLAICGKAIKHDTLPKKLKKVKSAFPGMQVRLCGDSGTSGDQHVRYFLRWETLDRNRDLPRSGPLPEPSDLTLYKIRYTQ